MTTFGIETHDDGSVTITYPDARTKNKTGRKWLKAECWETICKNLSVVKKLPLNPNRRDAVIQARKLYPEGSLGVIVTTAAEILGMDPEDQDARRKLCGLVAEMRELKQA